MTAAASRAQAGGNRVSSIIGTEDELRNVTAKRPALGWNPERFAREQIRGLVRRVFSPAVSPRMRQVVFSSVDSETDVRGICMQVGVGLALETLGSIAIVGHFPHLVTEGERCPEPLAYRDGTKSGHLQEAAIRLRSNLWLLHAGQSDEDSTSALHRYLSEIRSEFEFSIVEAPPVGNSDEAMAMSQFADGVVLVLSAQRARRVTAGRIKGMLQESRVHLLGTILCDREFPIPEKIYRHL